MNDRQIWRYMFSICYLLSVNYVLLKTCVNVSVKIFCNFIFQTSFKLTLINRYMMHDL